jgi:hypothetical protein
VKGSSHLQTNYDAIHIYIFFGLSPKIILIFLDPSVFSLQYYTIIFQNNDFKNKFSAFLPRVVAQIESGGQEVPQLFLY